MNNKVTAIISLVIGFAAGASASYIYLKEKLTKEFEKSSQLRCLSTKKSTE